MSEQDKAVEERRKQLREQMTPGLIASQREVVGVRKYKLHPTTKQKEILRKMFGHTMWTYNKCVEAVQEKGIRANKGNLRSYCVNADSELFKQNSWLKEAPYDVRDAGVDQFLHAYRSIQTHKKNGNISFSQGFMKKLHPGVKSRKITIHNKHYGENKCFYSSLLGTSPIRSFPPLPDHNEVHFDMTMTLNWLGEFHLLIPHCYEKQVRVNTEESGLQSPLSRPLGTICAVDPGVRTFGTVYDPVRKCIVEWGSGAMGRIMRLAYYADDLRSRIDATGEKTVGARKRYRMRKAFRRMSYRIQNLIKEFHYRFANWLCENYEVILFPPWDLNSMVMKNPSRLWKHLNKEEKVEVNKQESQSQSQPIEQSSSSQQQVPVTRQKGRYNRRKINNKVVRGLLTWSPCSFRNRLLHVSKRHSNHCKVVLVDESYTSKTCGQCGTIHHKLGGSKVYRCPNADCGHIIGRDFNGARNILLKFLTEYVL